MERAIAKLFIIVLPLRMLSFLLPITSIFGMQAESLSSIILVLGLLCTLYKEMDTPRSYSDSFLYYWKMIFVFAVISAIMSIYVVLNYGDYNGNSPFIATAKMILDFVQYGLVVVYCKRIYLVLNEDEIVRAIITSARIALIVGYLQIAHILQIPFLKIVYQVLAEPFSWRIYPDQIALTFLEPSWAAIYIAGIVIPIHMAQVIIKQSLISIVELILWIPVTLMTKSTTTYLLVFVALGVAVIRMLYINEYKSTVKIFAISVVSLGSIAISNIETIGEILGFDMRYALLFKTTDLSNQSTASRMIPLIGNWEIFKKFPLCGCGNGLQGYFYGELIPSEYYRHLNLDKAVYALLKGYDSSIPNGQLFFPALLSGYGLIGVILFIKFIIISINNIKGNSGILKEMYIIALLPLMIAGFKSEFVGIIYIWFVLAIPFSMNQIKTDKAEP